ncbi:protein GTLF3B-like [Tropilaelaps mercedesae]|uniref:Protein NATD1 n=1 Tax=Tropilaelaps mercedesae TaxID=418985 RepID=A0A1V9XK04_9ACAR|nr:protein GTLF3B-like [Tropilaelaps mercedesae]
MSNIIRRLASTRVLTRSVASQVQTLAVTHDKASRTFYVQMGNDKAILTYDEASPGILDLQHTEVPDVFRGKGVAALLAREAFDFVAKNGLKTKVTCTYLMGFFQKNIKKYSPYVVN